MQVFDKTQSYLAFATGSWVGKDHGNKLLFFASIWLNNTDEVFIFQWVVMIHCQTFAINAPCRIFEISGERVLDILQEIKHTDSFLVILGE